MPSSDVARPPVLKEQTILEQYLSQLYITAAGLVDHQSLADRLKVERPYVVAAYLYLPIDLISYCMGTDLNVLIAGRAHGRLGIEIDRTWNTAQRFL